MSYFCECILLGFVLRFFLFPSFFYADSLKVTFSFFCSSSVYVIATDSLFIGHLFAKCPNSLNFKQWILDLSIVVSFHSAFVLLQRQDFLHKSHFHHLTRVLPVVVHDVGVLVIHDESSFCEGIIHFVNKLAVPFSICRH